MKKKLTSNKFMELNRSFCLWYNKYCIIKPYYSFNKDCLIEFNKLFLIFNEYGSRESISQLTKFQIKTFYTIKAYLHHYYQYYVYYKNELIEYEYSGFVVYDRNIVEPKIINECFVNFEKGISCIEQAHKIDVKMDDPLNFLFPRAYRLVYYDKACFLTNFMDDDNAALEIFQYLLECEDRGIVKFSFTTRLYISNILLSEENSNIDLVLHYYNEMLANTEFEGFYEHKFMLAKKIYDYYYKNTDYDNALKTCDTWEEYCKEHNCNLSLAEEQTKLYEIINQKQSNRVKEKELVKEILGRFFDDDVISKMTNDVRILLSTSIKMYDHFFIDKGDCSDYLDYSPVNISGFKAIEEILYQIIGQKYFEYLKLQINLNFGDIPNGLKNFHNNNQTLKNTISNLEYGDAIYAMCYKITDPNGIQYVIRPTFKNFCLNEGMEIQKIDRISTFFTQLNELRIARNANSHKNRIVYTFAKECKEMLFDTIAIVNMIYSIFDIFFDSEE